MSTQTLAVEVPEEVVALLGSPERAAAKAREALVLALFREGHLSQSRATRVLGISRHELIDLLAEHDIPSGPATIEAYRQEVERVGQFLQMRRG